MRKADTTPRRVLVTSPRQVGEILRGRRKANALSQAQVATKLNVSQSRLSVLEGDPSAMPLDRFLALTKLLGFEIVLQEKPASPPRKTEW